MRFDDTIATVLAQPGDTASRRTAQWQQLVDLLAQRRADASSEAAQRGYSFLRAHRDAIDPAVRQGSAQSLAGLASMLQSLFEIRVRHRWAGLATA